MPRQNGGEMTQSQKDSGKKILMWIIIIIVILIVIYLIYYVYMNWKKKRNSEPVLIQNPADASQPQVFTSDKVPVSLNGSEYSYSFWIFINDWNYKFGSPKPILYRGTQDCRHANPSIWLYPTENKLMIRAETYDCDSGVNSPIYGKNNQVSKSLNPVTDPSILGVEKVCDIENIPLQRWVHVVVCLWNKTIDVYINGKLTRSCILDGVPKLNNGNVYVTPNGGYNGLISRLQFYNYALDPQKVYKLYKHGPYPGLWWWNQAKETMPKLSVGFNVNEASGDPMSGVQYGCGPDGKPQTYGDRGGVSNAYGDSRGGGGGGNNGGNGGEYNPFVLPTPN